MAEEVNIHVYIHLDLGGAAGTATLNRPAQSVTAVSAELADSADDEVETMLGRFERFERNSHARQVLEQLRDRRWSALLAEPRGNEAKSPATYIRVEYVGRIHAVTLYLNSIALVSAGSDERDLVLTLPHAKPGKGREVYFYHSVNRAGVGYDVSYAISAADRLQAWADGRES